MSIYEKHTATVVSVLVAMAVLFVIITLLYINVNKRKYAEKSLKEINESLEARVVDRTQELEGKNILLHLNHISLLM